MSHLAQHCRFAKQSRNFNAGRELYPHLGGTVRTELSAEERVGGVFTTTDCVSKRFSRRRRGRADRPEPVLVEARFCCRARHLPAHAAASAHGLVEARHGRLVYYTKMSRVSIEKSIAEKADACFAEKPGSDDDDDAPVSLFELCLAIFG